MKNLDQWLDSWRGVLEVAAGGEVLVKDAARLRDEALDPLVRVAVFAESEDERARARVLIWESARQTGVRPWSIQTLYEAMGRDFGWDSSATRYVQMYRRALARANPES